MANYGVTLMVMFMSFIKLENYAILLLLINDDAIANNGVTLMVVI